MQCEDVARALPALDDEVIDVEIEDHVATCLRCQAELARYRRMLRGLHELRTRYLEPAPGLLPQTLAALEAAGERSAVRSLLTGRRLAYAGAGVALAAGAAAVLLARARRRAGFPAAA